MDVYSSMYKNINPSSPRQGCNNPQIVFVPLLINPQPRDKIAPGTFKFILPLILAEKKIEPTIFPGGRVSFQSWEVWGWCDPLILKLDYFENILSDMHSKLRL